MVIRAKVGGHPPPSLTWYHDGRKVTADYATELDEDGGISFPSVEAKHTGEYRLYRLHSKVCCVRYIDHSWGCVQLSLIVKYPLLKVYSALILLTNTSVC